MFALDFASEMIEQARARVGRNGPDRAVRVYVGDMSNLAFEADFFDAIIAVGLIEYLADVDTALRQMHKVLKPGGILIVTCRISPRLSWRTETLVPKCKGVVKRALAAVGLRKLERSYLQRHFLPWRLDRQLRQIGFRKADSAFCTYGLSSSARFESFSLNLSSKLDRFGQSPIGILGTNYIVKVEKP